MSFAGIKAIDPVICLFNPAFEQQHDVLVLIGPPAARLPAAHRLRGYFCSLITGCSTSLFFLHLRTVCDISCLMCDEDIWNLIRWLCGTDLLKICATEAAVRSETSKYERLKNIVLICMWIWEPSVSLEGSLCLHLSDSETRSVDFTPGKQKLQGKDPPGRKLQVLRKRGNKCLALLVESHRGSSWVPSCSAFIVMQTIRSCYRMTSTADEPTTSVCRITRFCKVCLWSWYWSEWSESDRSAGLKLAHETLWRNPNNISDDFLFYTD